MSDELQHTQQYIDRITAFYTYFPQAIQYYDQLVDYLRTKAGPASLQPLGLYRIRDFSANRGLSLTFPFTSTTWETGSISPLIIVLEGLPLPTHIAFIGTTLAIRPEFFIGHLDASCTQAPKSGLYEYPSLPSRQQNCIQLTFASLIRSIVEGPKLDQLADRRLEVDEACRLCQKALFIDGRYGATRYRRIVVHDDKFCSIEQRLSFTVARRGSGWCAVILTDQGKSNAENHLLPWSTYDNYGRPMGSFPLIPFGSPMYNSDELENTFKELDQHHPLKNVFVRDEIDMALLHADPFFLLGSILSTVAQSWTPILNLMNECISEFHSAKVTEINPLLETLRQYVGILNRVEEILSEGLRWIEQGGCESWPSASEEPLRERKQSFQKLLQADFETLQKRCLAITRDCESATNLLVSYSQLVSSERGVDQAAQVHSLTKLASVFVPVSFAATLFGMNVKELKDNPSVWNYAVLAGCLAVVTLLALNWDLTKRKAIGPLDSIAKRIRRRRAFW